MGVVRDTRKDVDARCSDVDVSAKVRERGPLISLVERRDCNNLRIDAGKLWGNVCVLIAVSCGEHYNHILIDGVLNSSPHASVIAVHPPAAVDDESPIIITIIIVIISLSSDVVDRIRAVLIHASRQVNAKGHYSAFGGDTDNTHRVVHRRNGSGDVGAMTFEVVGNWVT